MYIVKFVICLHAPTFSFGNFTIALLVLRHCCLKLIVFVYMMLRCGPTICLNHLTNFSPVTISVLNCSLDIVSTTVWLECYRRLVFLASVLSFTIIIFLSIGAGTCVIMPLSLYCVMLTNSCFPVDMMYGLFVSQVYTIAAVPFYICPSVCLSCFSLSLFCYMGLSWNKRINWLIDWLYLVKQSHNPDPAPLRANFSSLS